MTPDDRLRQAVNEATAVHMTSKSEIVSYYREEYPTDWRVKFTDDMANITGQSRNTVGRQVRGDRWEKEARSGAVREAFAALGKLLPAKGRKIPPGGITVSVLGRFDPSQKGRSKGEKPRYREISHHFSGSAGEQFVQDPSLRDFFEEYGVDGEMFSDMMGDDATISVREG